MIPVQNFGGPPPKNFRDQKHAKFGQSSMANISGTDEDIQNQTSTFCTTIPLALGERSLVNLSPLITEIKC